MKKTLTVNLGGTVFHIDEDAYRLLDNYLSNLKIHFRKEAGADEIIDDIERRISELFTEKLAAGSQVITIAMWVKGRIYFCAQPVGQAAASTATPPDATKLGGEVGDAINASGLVFARVYYELNPETGRSEFVGREKMLELLADYPELKEAFEKETNESAEVVGKYLRQLAGKPGVE